jgi:hypothetical protein
MKKLIYILFLLPFFINAQVSTGKEQEFEDGIKNNASQTVTSSSYVTTTGNDGTQGKIKGEDISLSVVPPVTHFVPVSASIKGYFQGVDDAIGNISATTAGSTTRLWFTADQITLVATNFFKTNFLGKGIVASAQQDVINGDNEKRYFAQDLIGDSYITTTTFPKGVYAANLSVSTSPNSAKQRFTIEVYKCNTNGTPIASGVTDAVVGDLGVTVIGILDSGLLTLANASITNIVLSTNINYPFTVNVGERVRYHISAAKDGTDASNITESVYYGTSYNSYIDIPVPLNTDNITNLSTVTGINVTAALDNLKNSILPVDQTIIDGSTNAVSGNAVFDGLGTKLDKKYSSIKTVGVGGDYATLELLFANEPAGKTLIKLLDTQYTCVNPQFVVKNGWIIQGLGYGKTNITFSFTTPIDVNLSGLQVRTDCELLDFKVTSINNTNVGGYSQYSLHSDYNTPFKAQITRCWFKTISNPNVADANGYNGLAVGVGTWEGQELEFRECILQGQSVAIDNKYTLNLHNTYITGTHLLPCRVSFYNCQLTGGFTTVLISDNYSNDSELNSNRIKDLFEFVGCEIKGGLYLRSHSQSGTIDKKNGINFNFSGTNVDEFINTSDLVDTSLSNYDITSLPVTKDIEFFKNIGTTTILAGDFVAYVYANRKPEYHLTGLINTIIGVEKMTSANSFNFAGISLTDSGINNFMHLAKGSISYTRLGYSGLNIGDRVSFDSTTGDLVKTFFGGIGKVVKKTDTNRLGIELSPIGKIYNTFGTYTERGVLEILGNAGGAGHPTIWLKDKNVLGQLSNYAISVGSNTHIPPYYEQARFSINDNISQTERFSIDIQGITGINRKLKIFNQAVVGDSGAYNLLPTLDVSGFSAFGSTSNRFVLGRSFLSPGESGAYFEYGTNIANTTSIQSVSAGVSYRDLALNPQGGAVLVGSLVGTGIRTVVADASGKLSTDILPISGTYTPTLTNTLNVSSSVVHNFYYTRIGDIVTCTFTFTASVTTGSTITGITATLPINRSVTNSYYVGGGVVGPNTLANMSSGKVLLLNNTTSFIFYCIPTSTGVNYFTGTFQYSIN